MRQKIISKIRLDYEKIDACPNDCMLYCDNDEDRESCKRCNASRYVVPENGEEDANEGKRQKDQQKILDIFP